MAQSVNILLNVIGSYTDAALSTEAWQFGVRFRVSNTEADAVGLLPTDFQPTSASIDRTETSWTIKGNWSLSGPATAVFHVDDWLNDQVAPALATFLADAHFGAYVQVNEIKAYPIGSPDGRAIPAPPYAQGTPITLAYTGTLPHGTSGGLLPLQCASVVSLRTGNTGRRGRGRFFIPAPNLSLLGTNGLIGPSTVADMSAAAEAFLAGCQVALTVPNTLYVQPIVTGAPFTNYGLVTSVIVDNVADTQRRRTKSLIRTGVTTPLPAP